MDKDSKENRRSQFNKKNSSEKSKDKDFILEKRGKTRMVRDYKNKKQELEQEELWEQWSDEIH